MTITQVYFSAAAKCSPSSDAYGGVHDQVNCLPHTGSDIIPVVIGGLVLLILGFTLYIGIKRST